MILRTEMGRMTICASGGDDLELLRLRASIEDEG